MSLIAADSPHPVAATVERLIAELERRDIQVFARVDHAGGARAVGMELADEQVVIFGDPRAGTPLMQSDPAIGYELPLRLLVWDAGGHTKIGYRPPTQLADGYGVGDGTEILAKMQGLLEQLVATAAAT
jgi:uncharacterized protein (DUF302 family)